MPTDKTLSDLEHDAIHLEALIQGLDVLADRAADADGYIRQEGADAALPQDIAGASNCIPALLAVIREKADALNRDIGHLALSTRGAS